MATPVDTIWDRIERTLVGILGALAIIGAVLPRVDKFIAPGPRLTPGEHPKLFAQLENVAQATQQEMPAEVYLVPDINAWVAQRGGTMGFGSRRVMGLGLPLMQVLSCSQFRAVLAHEFGHYHGGDTKIGPWIYKTRGAIIRTVASLGRSWLQAPFRLYGMMFLRITHAVSRRQEYVADELAARTIGAKPLTDGLCQVHKAAPAFAHYWENECSPVLQAGFLPPVAAGFGEFVNTGSVAEQMNQHLSEQLAAGKTDPYDTHPPLKDRIAAVANLPAGRVLAEDPPSVSLLENVPALERELLARAAGAETVAKLKDIVWADVGQAIYVPQWSKLVQMNIARLRGVTPETLGTLAANLRDFGSTLVDFSGRSPFGQNAENLAVAVVGAAITLRLLQRGGVLQATLGSDICVTLNGHRLLPFALVSALKSGEMKPETWAQQCAELGLNGTALGTVIPAPPGAPE